MSRDSRRLHSVKRRGLDSASDTDTLQTGALGSRALPLAKFAILLCCFDVAPSPPGDILLFVEAQLAAYFRR
jgi:hypothetical protein